MHRRLVRERCVQILAKGRTQRRLEAARDAQLVDEQRIAVARSGTGEAADGLQLGRQPLDLQADAGAGRGGLSLSGAGLQGSLLCSDGPGLETSDGGLDLREARREPIELGRIGSWRKRRQQAVNLHELLREPRRLPLLLGRQRLDAAAVGTLVCEAGGERVEGFLGAGPDRNGNGMNGARLLLGRGIGTGLGMQPRGFLGQPGRGRLRLSSDIALALAVLGELCQPRLELRVTVARAGLLLLQHFGLVTEPVQDGAAPGLLLAQGRDVTGSLRLEANGCGLCLGRETHDLQRLEQSRFLGLDQSLCCLPGEMECYGLHLPHLRGDLLVALGLAGLPLQVAHLARQLAEHIAEPGKIAFGRLEPQLSLMAAAVQAGDTCRILQDTAALLGLGIHDLADLALAHESGRASARCCILEQQLHVACAHIAAVDAVDRARFALDVADDLDGVRTIQLGGCLAIGVVEQDHHLGGIARRAALGPREDHIVHGGRAHALVRGLAHDPAQGFQQIGLAAAIGTDDARQPALDQEIGRFDEGFEADEPQSLDVHGRVSFERCCDRTPEPSTRVMLLRGLADGCRLACQLRLHEATELIEAELAANLVLADEEGRRAAHAERPAALLHPQQSILDALIRQALVELIARHAGLGGNRIDGIEAHLLRYPARLLLEIGLVELEVSLLGRTPGYDPGGAGGVTDGKLAQHPADLAGIDIGLLDLCESLRVEGPAVRAGEGCVLDHGERRIGAAEHAVAEGARECKIGRRRMLDHLARAAGQIRGAVLGASGNLSRACGR